MLRRTLAALAATTLTLTAMYAFGLGFFSGDTEVEPMSDSYAVVETTIVEPAITQASRKVENSEKPEIEVTSTSTKVKANSFNLPEVLARPTDIELRFFDTRTVINAPLVVSSADDALDPPKNMVGMFYLNGLTALPCQEGVVIVNGHSNDQFYHLIKGEGLDVGDQVAFTLNDGGSCVYQVTSYEQMPDFTVGNKLAGEIPAHIYLKYEEYEQVYAAILSQQRGYEAYIFTSCGGRVASSGENIGHQQDSCFFRTVLLTYVEPPIGGS